jgi:hypothetical protein
MTGGWIVAFVLLSIVTGLLCILFLALARHVAALSTRLPEPLPLELSQGPGVGSRLEDQGIPPAFQPVLGPDERRADQLLLVFISTRCAMCHGLVAPLNAFARDASGDTTVLTAVSGQAPEGERFAKALRHAGPVVDPPGALSTSFGVSTLPFALLYERGQLKAKGVVNDREMLENLAAGYTRKEGDELLAAFEEQFGH